jgi:hypothetical protein
VEDGFEFDVKGSVERVADRRCEGFVGNRPGLASRARLGSARLGSARKIGNL